MTPEQIMKLEDEILVLESARDAKTGVRVMESDPMYRKDVFAMRVELSEAKAAVGDPEVRINEHQLHGLNGYDFARDNKDVKTLQAALGVKNPATGRRWVEEKPALRAEIEKDLSQVMEGERVATMTPELAGIINQVRSAK